jgi:hypothetical protein
MPDPKIPGSVKPTSAAHEEHKQVISRLLEADRRIEQRYRHFGEAALGVPTSKDVGSRWTFANGSCLVHNDARQAVFEIHGAIYQKWLELGGLTWGIPCSDELPTVDKVGRFNHFNDVTASIHWHPNTGAHGVWGAILKHWSALGWETSYLGYPVTDEAVFPQSGRANEFQGGGIYFWGDVGAIDLRDVVVQYTGMHCFGETDWDQSSAGDEPYAIVGVTTPQVDATVRSKVYQGIDAGNSCPDLVEVYRGRPFGINITSVVMEHDFGDPDKYKEEVQVVVKAAHEGGKKALGAIPFVGHELAEAAEHLDQYVPKVGAAVSNWLDWGDDQIGSSTLSVSPRELVLLAARGANKEFDGIGFKLESNLISGQGASYKCYYGVVPA